MSPTQPLESIAAADVLTGYYKRARMTQQQLADAAEMSITSLQKKLKGNAPVTATDLVVLSRAIGVDAADVMAEIMKEIAKRERRDNDGVSEVPVSLDAHRRNRTPAEMTEEEMEGVPNAAGTDPELGYDEPEQP